MPDSTSPQNLVKLSSRDYNAFIMRQLWLLCYVIHKVAVVWSLINVCSFHKHRQGRRDIHIHVTRLPRLAQHQPDVRGCHKLIYLPAFLKPSNDGFRSFDKLIAATDIKAKGGREGAGKINTKLMLSVAVLSYLT